MTARMHGNVLSNCNLERRRTEMVEMNGNKMSVLADWYVYQLTLKMLRVLFNSKHR